MFKRTRFALLAVVAALATACSSAAPGASTPPQAGTAPTGGAIRVGFTSSQSGSLTKESTEQTQGLRLWADEINARGGLTAGGSTFQIQLVSYDDESKQDRVQELYTRLITEDKVDFLISPYGSATAAASAVVSEQYGRTNLIVGAASNSTFTRGYTHAFQVYSPASKYLTGALDLLKSLNPSVRRVALVNEKDPFSTDVANATRDYAEKQGLQVVMNEGYDTGTTDFAPLINKMAAENPEGIFGGGHFADGSTLARQLSEKQVKTGLVALLVAPAVPEFADLGNAALGVIAPSQWEPQATYSVESARQLGIPYTGASVQDFTGRYRTAYGYEPGYHAAGGYVSGVILEKAVADAGTTSTEKVEAALAKMDVLTFFGRIKFSTENDFGLQVGHDMVYLQWQRGDGAPARQIVWPQAASTAKALYPKP
jgi:branched-chain amino acid transport system substrate-binding protein